MIDDPMIERLRAARSRPSVLKIRWLGFNYGKRFRRVLVVEGKEDKVVYSQWMQRLQVERNYEFFVAGGRRNVLKVKHFESDDESEVYFFVDADFDENSDLAIDDRIYVLPRYSIENYLVCPSVLRECLQTGFDLDGHPEVREEICHVFESDYDTFLEISRDWHRQIFFARRSNTNIDDEMPNALDIIARVQFGNVAPGDQSAADVFAHVDLSDGEAEILNPIFESLHPRYSYRGKFALKFLKIWLSSLLNEMRDQRSAVITMPPGCDLKITWDEFTLGSLASRSELPTGLDEFLSCSRP